MNAIANLPTTLPAPTFDPLQLLACENAVKAHPNQTAAELGDLTGAAADTMRTLLQQLSREGRAHIAGFTRCRVTGSTANTWMAGRDPHLLPKEYAGAMVALEVPVDPRQQALL